MELVETSGLTLKPKGTAANENTPNGQVRKALLELKTGQAIYMADLAKDMCEHFVLSTDDLKKRKMRAYIRVGDVYNKLAEKAHLAKFKDAAGFTLIGRVETKAEAVIREKEAAEFGL